MENNQYLKMLGLNILGGLISYYLITKYIEKRMGVNYGK